MATERQDTVWQQAEIVNTFINEVRGGVPYACDQIGIMMRLINCSGRPLQRFADLGCGNGVLSRAILTVHPTAQAVLFDFSGPMMDAARYLLADHQPQPVFAVADLAEPLWLESARMFGPYDVIASSYAIHHLTDARKHELYGEIFDLLEPGGLFVNVEHVASHTRRVAVLADLLMVDALYAYQSEKNPEITREQVARDFVHRPDKDANILAPVEDQCDWLRDIGFRDVDCFFKVFELAVFGGWKMDPADRRREFLPGRRSALRASASARRSRR